MTVSLADLILKDKTIEIGCTDCGLHIFVPPASIPVARETPVPELSQLLKCCQCGVINTEPNHPIWARPDARPPKMGAGT